MIKRTIYFGSEAYLSTKDQQMRIRFADKEKQEQSVPIEDIGVLILDHYRLSFTQTLLTRLLANNAAVITCDEKHMPQGMLLNLDGNTIQQERFASQISASLPLKKSLWQQTTKAKIHNQAAVLAITGIGTNLTDVGNIEDAYYPFTDTDEIIEKLNNKNPHENMQYWEQSVAPGDPDNYEARAAAYYWKTIFVEHIQNFKRGRFEAEPNNLLNYGYAILRAITARNLVGSGLLPTFGIHHHNRYNAYALADDIMEPYRPFVDLIVLGILENFDEVAELTPELKRELLQISTADVVINGKRSPLMVAMQQTTASLADCFGGTLRKIKYPEMPE